jgi:hypothetical protein
VPEEKRNRIIVKFEDIIAENFSIIDARYRAAYSRRAKDSE